MARATRIRPVLARVAALLTLLPVALAAAPDQAQARWGRPFQLAAPQSLDVLAPELAVSASGASAAAFGLQDVDTPGSAQAYLTRRSAGGAIAGPTPVAGAAQILDLAYDGPALELLTGTAPAGLTCCSSVQAIAVGPGGAVGSPRTLVGGLAGATDGQLLTLGGGRMLAAVATERGVWVSQASRGGRFGRPHLLTGAGQMPQTLAAVRLAPGASLVAWTSGTGPGGAADPRHVYGAGGTRRAAPHRARVLVTVPAGHRIDELGVAPHGGSAATVAWIESWYDRGGGFHSVVRAQDLGPHGGAPRTLSPAGRQASGLSFAGDGAGDQVASWELCTVQDACVAQAAGRRARAAGFGGARTLGAIDAAQAPALALGPSGQAVVGWIDAGDPVAAVQAGPGRPFGDASVLSRAGYALDLTAAAGPRGRALVAWSQGTLNPSVVGVAYR